MAALLDSAAAQLRRRSACLDILVPSFRDYLLARKYDFGRGSEAAWRFIALARGDSGLPDIGDRRELEKYLARNDFSGEIRAGAHSAWRSFTAYRSGIRREQ